MGLSSGLALIVAPNCSMSANGFWLPPKRQAIVQLRSARPVLFDPVSGQGVGAATKMCQGIDFDLFGGHDD